MMSRIRSWLIARRDRDRRLSAAWLRQQDHMAARIDYHGPSIAWPIQKLANDTPAERRPKFINLQQFRDARKKVA